MTDTLIPTATRERLQTVLAAYGANSKHWPSDERDGLERLASEDAEARAWIDEAAELDRWLDTAPLAEPGTDLADRVLAMAPRPAKGLKDLLAWILPDGPVWRPVSGLAAALVLGAWLGGTQPALLGFTIDGEDTEVTVRSEVDALVLGTDFLIEEGN